LSTSTSEYHSEILDGRDGVERAGALLRSGKLVVIPTETVYGLAASAVDSVAVRAIFAAKERPQDNPLIVHLRNVTAALELCPPESAAARRLLEAFAPGPITVVVPSDGRFAPEINHGLDTVAIRVPALVQARDVIAAAGVPLAAPSANRSGRPSPTSLEMAIAEMDGRVAAILDGGPCTVGIESTVVDATAPDRLRILRPGYITAEEIRRETGLPVETIAAAVGDDDVVRRSPGTRYRHYTPHIPVVLVAPERVPRVMNDPRLTGFGSGGPVWVLRCGGAAADDPVSPHHVVTLASPEEYARRVFHLFWSAERQGAAMIIAEEPDRATAPGLADRLQRAATCRYPELPGSPR